MSERSILTRAVAILSGALLLAACARFGGAPPGSSPSPDEKISHPAGDELVLRVEHLGGFVPADYLLTRLPVFTLTGDGRMIVPGAQDLSYPGQLLPPILVRGLDEAGIQAVLREVLASGQLDADHEWRGAQMHVADAADTVFTLRAGGREVRVLVYGLGTMGPGMTDLSAEERGAHASLSALLERLSDLGAWLPASDWTDAEWHPYESDALRLLVRDADGEAPEEGGLVREERLWPVAGDPARFGTPSVGDQLRCGVVTGADAASWYEALASADQLTRWTHGGHRYQVTARPLLPDEPRECPAPA